MNRNTYYSHHHDYSSLKGKGITSGILDVRIVVDSKTNLTKARGYVFRKESNLIYKCHNCGIGANLNNFLKHLVSQLHDDYIKEKFLDNGKDRDTQAYEKFSTHAPYLKGSSFFKI